MCLNIDINERFHVDGREYLVRNLNKTSNQTVVRLRREDDHEIIVTSDALLSRLFYQNRLHWSIERGAGNDHTAK